MLYRLIILISILSSFSSFAQNGQTFSYNFLNQPVSARIGALGTGIISLKDSDVNLFFYNPASLDTAMHTSVSTGYQYLPAGIRNYSIAYGHSYKNIGTFAFGILNSNSGDMTQTDMYGNVTGTYSATSNAFVLGYGKKVNAYSLGVNLKYASSSIQNYKSAALLLDAGALFKHPKKDMNIALTIKNAGFLLKNYTVNSQNADLPFDVQLGLSRKLEHMPMRFSVTAHHLYTYNIRFVDPNAPLKYDLSGNVIKESDKFYDKFLRQTDNFFRHFNFGSEFLFGKNFNLRLGYSHLMRKEMNIPGGDFNFSGFSSGFMIRIKGVAFHYGYTNLHPAKGFNTIQLDMNINSYKKKI